MQETSTVASTAQENSSALVSAMINAMKAGNPAQAELHLEELVKLTERSEDDPNILLFKVLISIQNGHGLDALRALNDMGEGKHSELKVLCMYFTGDPMWEGLAVELADNSPLPHVRRSMNQLLGRSVDEET